MDNPEYAPQQSVPYAHLDELIHSAQASDRKRLNLNLHVSPDEPCQRFFNAMEPESYLRPHRQPKRKLLVGIRGHFAAIVFDDAGHVVATHHFGAADRSPNCAVEIPAGVWNTVISLESGSVLLEVKSGPFHPQNPPELASWSPEAGTREAEAYLANLRRATTDRS
ncbi:WbuC family cupin fold metalloprotein [Luteimonas sp. FXH3W]|uniref:WbuC family cupin fold metalloprotein n=1 Tax=Aquilutibacter rugosus TaxID=3115820 RepID=A0ABU7UW54_9GAMM